MIIKTKREAAAYSKFNAGIRLNMDELKLVERILNRTINASMPKRIVDEIPTADMEGAKLLAETFGYSHKIGNRFYKEIVSKDWKTKDTNKAEVIQSGKGFVLRMVRYA